MRGANLGGLEVYEDMVVVVNRVSVRVGALPPPLEVLAADQTPVYIDI